MKNFSLKWKITVFVGFIIFSLMASFSMVVIYGEKNALLEKMEEIGLNITESLAERTLDPMINSNFPLIHNYLEDTEKLESIKYIMVLEYNGKCIAHTKRSNENRIFMDKIYSDLLSGEFKSNSYSIKKKYYEENKKAIDILEIGKVIGLKNSREVYGAVIIGFSYGKINEEIQHTLMAIVYITIVAIIIGFVLAFLLSELVIKPITEMMGAVKSISDGDYDVKVKIDSKDEIGILGTTLNMMTDRLKLNIEELNKQIYYLSSLHKVGNVIAAKIFDLNELLKVIVTSSTDIIKCSKCSIMLFDEQTGEAVIKFGKGMSEDAESIVSDLRPTHGGQITDWILKNQKPLFVKDIMTDERFDFSNKVSQDDHDRYSSNSFIAVPLQLKDRIVGIISVTEKNEGIEFNSEDIKILTILSQQVVIAIDNAKVHSRDVENKRIEKELEIAHRIQENMLPDKVASIENVEISAKSIPAKEVGGDYFDIWEINRHTCAFTIADVSGKGVPAALMMVMIRTILKTEIYAEENTSVLMKTLNNLLIDDIESAMFATIFLARLDSQTGELRFTNGGHNYPMIFHSDREEPELLETTGFFIGMFPDPHYDEMKITLKKGDTVILYTDGITEASNSSGEMFGMKRFCSLVSRLKYLGAKEIQDKIIEEVEVFAGGDQDDDITLIVLKYD